ncbi:MAG: xthA 3 [Hyphomicrobiales bacterium]|nr:xthA 3 [Hyphomicrobiales bacterium]
MRIATWNVNSVRQRLDHLLTWLKEAEPDVVCLQEIKCQDEAFPRLEIESAGYNVAVHGQKGFNGVAILSKHPIEEPRMGLPGDDEDAHSRYIEALVSHDGKVTRVASIYLPNGNGGAEKYAYKLAWMERLRLHAAELLKLEEALVLAGDFNVIPEPRDAKTPAMWVNDALFLPETRAAWRRIANLGLTDALRAVTDAGDVFTFWDYTSGAWRRNEGIRIDHLLLSPQAADRLKTVAIDKHVRGWEKPSDHVPIRIDLA